MNKTAIKNYAIWARVQLIENAKQRAYEYEISEKGSNRTDLDTVSGRLLTPTEKKQRVQLIEQIHQKGYTQVMEEAAYTWFNRFIALRFMEVNGYLPSKVRVFTDENGAFKPDILKEALTVELEGLDRNRVVTYLEQQQNEELYKYLLITQCNALNSMLPVMFEKIDNWSELLFPANLLKEDSVIGQLVTSIPEEDWQDAVQIIGWMYQYYNSELKDETFALLKRNVKITKERIPAATQLFTPDWIVRYMVENSLGRLWYEGHQDFDKSEWKYYLDEAEQEPQVEEKLAEIRKEYAKLKPEDIKVIDPCMGSGHILVYAFDVLMQIYLSAGWSERDATKSILENNLYGLDIDDRAGQLAYFAVMMKARKYSRRILNSDVKPNVLSIQDSSFMTDELISYVANQDSFLEMALVLLRKTLNDAKEYGSILSIPELPYDALYERLDIISRSYVENLFEVQYQQDCAALLLPLIRQAQVMAQKNDVVVTNPPYMGNANMNSKLSEYIKDKYHDSKSDMFAVFMSVAKRMTRRNGFQAMITMQSWMFLVSFEKLRKSILDARFVNLVHLGANSFDSSLVQSVAFITTSKKIDGYKAIYVRLIEEDNSAMKEKLLTSEGKRYIKNQIDFLKIDGAPIAYWISQRYYDAFQTGVRLGSLAYAGQGMATTNNNRFLRLWFEVENSKIGFDAKSEDDTLGYQKWFLYNKGGEFRKWYGDNDYVVNFQNRAEELSNYIAQTTSISRRIANRDRFFLECFSWSLIGNIAAFRYKPAGFIFDVAGMSCFSQKHLKYLLGLCNSKVAQQMLLILAPTVNFQCGDIANIPVYIDMDKEQYICNLVENNIHQSKKDWDSFEFSWDFICHPMVIDVPTAIAECTITNSNGDLHVMCPVEYAYFEWKLACEDRFTQLKSNEEELNRIFIDIYGLQDELTPEVEDKDVTVRKADLGRDIRSLISYAVGCMFGRYSLDCDGLAYAGGAWDASKYKTFIPDSDNIIPICDDEYFDDDMTGRFVKWVETVYGKETLEENLKFIADALGGKGTPQDVIRSYFLNDFYADHLKIYQKRPIYWLFDSGKKNGFKALIYMHRYQPDLLARMRTDYVHEQQERYRTQLQMLEDSTASATPSERVKLNKQITKLKDQSLEIRQYEEKIHHLADQMITIDLDDGVKANYAKFEDVLAKIK